MQAKARYLSLILLLLCALTAMIVTLSAQAGVNEVRGIASTAIIVDTCTSDPVLGDISDGDSSSVLPSSSLPSSPDEHTVEQSSGRAYPSSDFGLRPYSRAPPVIF